MIGDTDADGDAQSSDTVGQVGMSSMPTGCAGHRKLKQKVTQQ
jgi:hypothetical protein